MRTWWHPNRFAVSYFALKPLVKQRISASNMRNQPRTLADHVPGSSGAGAGRAPNACNSDLTVLSLDGRCPIELVVREGPMKTPLRCGVVGAKDQATEGGARSTTVA